MKRILLSMAVIFGTFALAQEKKSDTAKTKI